MKVISQMFDIIFEMHNVISITAQKWQVLSIPAK